MSTKAFRITDKKGFQMTFANGYTVSVQFGAGNYCDNRNDFGCSEVECASNNAEVAIWDVNGEWVCFGADEVVGWQTADLVAKLLASTAALPSVKKLAKKKGAECENKCNIYKMWLAVKKKRQVK